MSFQANSQGTGGFLNPQEIIENIDIIKEGMKVADFGSGAGYFSILLARKVGKDGEVFAIDVLKESLEVVESKAKSEGFENVKTIRGNLENKGGSGLKEGFCDIIFIANLLFQTEDDKAVIEEVKRVLKKNGMVVFLEWIPGIPFGPEGKKIKKDEAINLFKEQGLVLKKEFPTDNYHYGLIFEK
ncbi:MAG: methyltransferase domain-containing protein [Candidatus Pacebacteria bacterium]|nr:methyltransferase domain-containing protein [Candidatus Paceibacterota bacterium]